MDNVLAQCRPGSSVRQVTIAVAGGGSRGTTYAGYAVQHPDQARVVAVAEPRDYYRENLAKIHGIPRENVFKDWRELAARERLADAVIIATQDAMHAEPAIALADKGYNILLEKPMAPNERDCRRIVEAALRKRIIFAVCHVMRYAPFTQRLKALLDSGAIGEIINIQMLEPVGYWHQAHSFVRGNWRNSKESSFMLLAKCCHDLDWLRYMIGAKYVSVASFGSLKHFRRENQPVGAADRCLDCGIEPNCPYSAKKIYFASLAKGPGRFPVSVITPEPTVESVTKALREGLYGRCVYACDNDVVDNQVVIMRFEHERTASLTMTAFNQSNNRRMRIFGTLGEATGDGVTISHYDFLTDKTEVIDTRQSSSVMQSHGGGDYEIMKSFVAAVSTNDKSRILSGPMESLETHLAVFAAERSRLEGVVVNVSS
ncbi:MAG TPA: Gfo/Idh/MocA family oxidoreductase [Candidatus Brocadiia bacterium]|nr:Gfo/Idh/MocA family oxidoreductase [Candidatus Brocadiia bacterium]